MGKIDRCAGIDVDTFVKTYLAANRPVIVTDAVERWGHADIWNVDFFSKEFGAMQTQVYGDLFDLEDVVTLDEYFDEYWRNSETQSDDTPYVRWYAKFKPEDFVWADEVFAILSPYWSAPYFLPSTGYLLPVQEKNTSLTPVSDAFPAKGVFISAKKARTSLHRDPWGSDAILCQMHGSKALKFYCPSLSWTSGNVPTKDVPSLDAMGLLPTYEDELQPGEVLFIPAGWYHHVETLSNSISLTWNFVHMSCWARFFEYLAHSDLSENDQQILQYFAKIKKS